MVIKTKLYLKENINGIKVIRIWSYIAANQGFFKRVLDYMSYAVMAVFTGLFVKTDIIIATSPQFFTAVGGRVLSFFKRKPWVMEVRDIWPESIVTVGAVKADCTTVKFLEKVELHLYKSADIIIVVTDAFKETIINKGILKEKIEVVKNGANRSLFKPVSKDKNLLAVLNLENKIIVGYIGTHGLAHSLDFVIDTIAKLRDIPIHFLFVGDGAIKKKIQNQAVDLGLTNITFIGLVSKDKIVSYLSILDCMLVPLKKETNFKTVIPSKIFETAAMQIPILLGVDGEAREMIEKYNAGLYFEPENEKEMIRQLKRLWGDPSLCKLLKAGGKRLAMDFDRKKMAKKMHCYCQSIVQ